jgi:hypothetical protein
MARRAQLQIQEMAFMLVAVVLLFALVSIIVMSITYRGLINKANEIERVKLLTAITNLADNPELMCIDSKSNCIDEDKLISLRNKSSYYNYWPFSSLAVIKSGALNKDESKMVECTFANYPNCDIHRIYDKKVEDEKSSSSFVVLCRKEYENSYTYERCEVGKIIAGVKIKKL